MEAYQYPHYYAIALAPSDPGREIDFFEAAIDRFSKGKVNRVFELGAGTAPYLEEWHKRGYAYCGLDLSPAMIEFGREKAQRCGIEAKFVLGDMRDLDRGLGPFDLAYVLLGSLYVRSNREFLDHLDRVAGMLAPGEPLPVGQRRLVLHLPRLQKKLDAAQSRHYGAHPLPCRARRSDRANLQ